jgi:acylphosphatase
MSIARLYTVTGIVQGVGFRYYTYHYARGLGITGYVKNLYDGSVEVYAIGNADQHEQLQTGLWKGPSYSQVSNVSYEEVETVPGYISFDIHH